MKQDSVLYTLCSDAASKHATQAYFDCLRAEIERHRIPVTVISPGYIRTNLSVNAVTGDGSKYGGEVNSNWWWNKCGCIQRQGFFNSLVCESGYWFFWSLLALQVNSYYGWTSKERIADYRNKCESMDVIDDTVWILIEWGPKTYLHLPLWYHPVT